MFKQPRVPQRRENTPLADFVYELTLFLKDFCIGAWQESKRQRAEIETLRKSGVEGPPGPAGADGYTPQKGKDYWTEDDIQSMVNQAVNGVLAQKSSILSTAYPVGSLYMSTVSTNPNTLFGFGTWERIQDRFLLAAGDSYAAGASGGTATHTHKYKTGARVYYGMVAGADADAHMAYDYVQGKWIPAVKDAGQSSLPVKANSGVQTSTKEVSPYFMASEAQVETKSNLPPYLAVYVWKRTA